jgi:hypothetical protein
VRQDGTEGFYQSIGFGLRQGAAMSRLVLVCIVLALMAQSVLVYGQTDPSYQKGEEWKDETGAKVTTLYFTLGDKEWPNADPFHMVVIGDSIAWGCGLYQKEKYHYLVADWLQKTLKRPVEVTVLAHTGATIAKPINIDASKHTFVDPELGSWDPVLLEQANHIPNPGDVELILVSGGINDVGVDTLIFPIDKSYVINDRCQDVRDTMNILLRKLLNKCAKSVIIVTDYYTVVSKDTPNSSIKKFADFIEENDPNWVHRTFSSEISNSADIISNNCVKFDGESRDSLSDSKDGAVYAANEYSRANFGKDRVYFAAVHFPLDRSYGTSKSLLWELVDTDNGGKTNDHKYYYRASLCDRVSCNWDDKIQAIAHPNVEGDQQYYSAIQKILEHKLADFGSNSNNGQPSSFEPEVEAKDARANQFEIIILNSAGYRAGSSKVIIDRSNANTTDSQGHLLVSLVDGNHTIDASKPGYGIGNWSGYLNHTQIKQINITLIPAPKYLFTIGTVNSAGFAVEGSGIKVDGMLRGTTGPTGDVGIELVDGNHTIEANKIGYGSGNWTGRLDHNKVKGAVVKLDGALEYPFRIVAVNAANYTMEDVRISIDGKDKGDTDKRGELRAMLTEGSHTIEANKTDYGSGNWTGFLNYNQSKGVVVRLNGALEYPFNVTVVNAANYTIENAKIRVGGKVKGVTDPQGSLRTMLSEGNQTIRADKAGYGSGNWTGNLSLISSFSVVVQINGALEYPFNITVTNPARYVVQDANVSVDGKPAGFTNANGVLRAMITEGNHTIEANKTGYHPGNWTGRLNHSQMNGLVIELGGSSILMNLKPIDLCLVLDTSGSMADPECIGKSKIQAVKEAAEDAIAAFYFPGTSSRVAVVSFSHVSSTAQEFTNNFFEAYSNVSLLSADGATSFGQGLSQGLDEFRKLNSTDHVQTILFMSDGMHNTPPEYGYYLALCRNMGIRVYTIGYGSEADHDLLKEMAALSGGEYIFADPCGDKNRTIKDSFIRLQMNISGSRQSISASGVVSQNQTVNATSFDVPPDSKYASIVVIYPGSHLRVFLLDPDGKVADPEDYVYTEDKRVISIRLKDPKPGNWTVQVYGDQVNGTEPYTIYVSPKYVAPTVPAITSKSIVIKETSGETLRNYPVQITLDSRNFPSKAESNGSDINILDQKGRELPYWVEYWDDKGKKAVFWVKVPEIPANGEVRLAVLSGNPGVSAETNGSEIFDFFDEFNDPSETQDKWTAQVSGPAQISKNGDELKIHADARSIASADLVSKASFGPNVAVRFMANISAGQNNDRKGIGLSRTNVGKNFDQIGDSVLWRGQDINLYSCHKYLVKGSNEISSACYPVTLNYPAEDRVWEIRWLDSQIDYEPDGTGGPHKNIKEPSEFLPMRFSINTSVAAIPSDISLDWICAWKCAPKEPLVVII